MSGGRSERSCISGTGRPSTSSAPACPSLEVQPQFGHARIDTTTLSTKRTNPERRSYADRVA